MTEIQRKIYLAEGDAPNGYQSTPIGFLPSDWEYAKLSDLSLELTETAGEKKYETVSISAGIGFVNQAKKFGKELSGKQYEKYIVLHKGDFSYNKGNSNRYPQGCIYRLNDREEAAVPNVFESFRIVKGCPEYYEQLFICGFLNHQLFRLINHGVRDDGLLNLTGTDFYSCLLPVPPLREQERIVDILSTCDRTIDYYEEKVEQYRKLKKYLLEKMFPRKGAAVPEIRFPGFTDTWEQRKLSDLIIEYKETVDSDCTLPVLTSSKTEGVLLQEEHFGRQQQHDITGYNKLPRNYCTYRNRSDGVDFTFNINKCCDMGIISKFYPVFCGKDNDTTFISLVLNNSDEVVREIGYTCVGTGQKVLSFLDLQKMKIRVPSYDEQRHISDLFDDIDNLITLHQREADAWKTKKKALAQLLLTGIVRTTK